MNIKLIKPEHMNLTANASVDIQAPPSEVWKALVTPQIIKKYLFGTDTKTDWQPGSRISFTGEWEGKPYEDKGTILANEKEKKLSYTYLSSFSSLPDLPENYAVVTFELQPQGNKTRLTLTQDHCTSEESRQHSEQNWNTVLNTMKEMLEAKS
jgi:uncharacterized protein YndB with AHSA1/START domain